MRGYTHIVKILMLVSPVGHTTAPSEEKDQSYIDTWSPSNLFLNKSKLLKTTRDKIEMSKIFVLSCPSYLWDLPKISDVYQEQLVANLLGLFLCDAMKKDFDNLIFGKRFIRFMLYQDEPDELHYLHPYVYGYIKNIDECIYDSHKKH